MKINKKYLSALYLVILTIGTIISLYMPKQEHVNAMEETVVIPKEAIRLRILANSDNHNDQEVKRAIRDAVNADITNWVKDLTSLEDARTVIQQHLPEVENRAKEKLQEFKLNQSVNVSFGKANFPTKLYGQYLYPAGEYEAIVITLGEGKGANWWCVLFPPLCFLDFSSGTAVTQGSFEDQETGVIETVDKAVDSPEEETTPVTSNLDDSEREDEEEKQPDESQNTESELLVQENTQPMERKFFLFELFKDIF
ncbi:stage II sporulation protein R [Peribacillus alkalitolerans]|uniref:stage II sporulation protein R n=1 Tax=Peribacillus alkalitolerans TaxID=1550385 RepID=UPI0013D39922|nr:stage II sporulation protein R [Peribacillus alkalitolerans]